MLSESAYFHRGEVYLLCLWGFNCGGEDCTCEVERVSQQVGDSQEVLNSQLLKKRRKFSLEKKKSEPHRSGAWCHLNCSTEFLFLFLIFKLQKIQSTFQGINLGKTEELTLKLQK